MIGKSSQVNLLSNLLQEAEVRHKIVSQNIANLNSPGYRSLDVRFDRSLESEAGQSEAVVDSAVVEETDGLLTRENGNNVDLDRELGSLTKNSMEFETYSHLLVSKFSLLRSAITGQ